VSSVEMSGMNDAWSDMLKFYSIMKVLYLLCFIYNRFPINECKLCIDNEISGKEKGETEEKVVVATGQR
jgi:hypothetical protein